MFIRKQLKKGVLLYVHLNLSLALLLALVLFMTGLETATRIPVSSVHYMLLVPTPAHRHTLHI